MEPNQTVVGKIALDEQSQIVLARFADSVDTLSAVIEHANDIAERVPADTYGETGIDITPDLTEFNDAMSSGDSWENHASYGSTPPERCACGQPIHAGSVWIPGDGTVQASVTTPAQTEGDASTLIHDPVVTAPLALEGAQEGDAWLVRFSRESEPVVALVLNDERGVRRFAMRDSLSYGIAPRTTDIDSTKIESARLLYRQGENVTSVASRVASAVFTDDFVNEYEQEVLRRIDAQTASLKRDYTQACQTIALMHEAATGRSGEAPTEGVVEDMHRVRLTLAETKAALESMTVRHANVADELVAQQQQNETLHRQFGEMSQRREALDQIIYRARTVLRDDATKRMNGGDAPSKRETLERVVAILGDVEPHMIARFSGGYHSRSFEKTRQSLDDLRLGAVVLDTHGDAWQQREDGMWKDTNGTGVNSSLLAKYAPFTVISEGRA